MGWKIYYSNGDTFSGEDGSPKDAPGFGIQIIVQDDPEVGRTIQSGRDWYVWNGEEWIAMDNAGLVDWLVNTLKLVKMGRSISNQSFRRLFRAAMDDPDFSPKSGKLSGEKHSQ